MQTYNRKSLKTSLFRINKNKKYNKLTMNILQKYLTD